MVNIMSKLGDMVKVSLAMNIIIFFVAIFYSPKWLLITSSMLNSILMAAYMILRKYGFMFSMLAKTTKAGRDLNKMLGKLNG